MFERTICSMLIKCTFSNCQEFWQNTSSHWPNRRCVQHQHGLWSYNPTAINRIWIRCKQVFSTERSVAKEHCYRTWRDWPNTYRILIHCIQGINFILNIPYISFVFQMTLWITKERNQIINSKISAGWAYLYYLIPDFWIFFAHFWFWMSVLGTLMTRWHCSSSNIWRKIALKTKSWHEQTANKLNC